MTENAIVSFRCTKPTLRLTLSTDFVNYRLSRRKSDAEVYSFKEVRHQTFEEVINHRLCLII